MGEGIARESGIDMYTLLFLKWITSKVLLYSTGKFARCHVVSLGGRGIWGTVGTCVCLSPFAVHLKLS